MNTHRIAAGAAAPHHVAPLRRSARWCARMALCIAVAVPLLGGCAAVQRFHEMEPWVKPYERERLADPIMQFSRDALSEKHREHVHSVREGARGATGVQGGGCGCN